MEIVYKATPRRLDLSDDDDDEDENVIFTANGLKGSDEQALMKGSRNKSSGRQPGILVRAPGRVAVTLTLFLSFFGCVSKIWDIYFQCVRINMAGTKTLHRC